MATTKGSRQPQPTHLQVETETFEKLLPTWSAEEGKFAVIHGEQVIGLFESYNDALAAGFAKAGLSPFLVKQISTTGALAHFTRDLVCHT